MSWVLSEITRNLRKRQTKSEAIFWNLVRNRKVGVKFLRQYALQYTYEGMHRLFVADFYCAEKKLVVEIDGGIHETQQDYDTIRTEMIESLGLTVIRFMNDELSDLKGLKEKLMEHINN